MSLTVVDCKYNSGYYSASIKKKKLMTPKVGEGARRLIELYMSDFC